MSGSLALDYTPLRGSDQKSNYSNNNAKSKSVRRKPRFNNNNGIDNNDLRAPVPQQLMNDNPPPSLLLVTLRQERDSLSMALTSELANRKMLEQENEKMRRKVKHYERELVEVRE